MRPVPTPLSFSSSTPPTTGGVVVTSRYSAHASNPTSSSTCSNNSSSSPHQVHDENDTSRLNLSDEHSPRAGSRRAKSFLQSTTTPVPSSSTSTTRATSPARKNTTCNIITTPLMDDSSNKQISTTTTSSSNNNGVTVVAASSRKLDLTTTTAVTDNNNRSSTSTLPPRSSSSSTPSSPSPVKSSTIGTIDASSLSLSKKIMRESSNNHQALMTVSNNHNIIHDAIIDSTTTATTSSRISSSRRDDNHSLSSSLSRERKEDDPSHLRYHNSHNNDHHHPSEQLSSSSLPAAGAAMPPPPPPVRSTKPTSESGRARGATPPRPVGYGSSRNRNNEPVISNNSSNINEMLPVVQPQQQQQQPTTTTSQQHRRSSRRSASPNRIPRVPVKPSSVAGGGGGGACIAAADGGATTASQTSSPRRFSKDQGSSCHHSHTSSGGGSMSKSKRSSHSNNNNNNKNWQQWAAPPPRNNNNNNTTADPADHEQALFEQRLCEDSYGVAVRKINQNGKPNLRYVKCITIEHDADTVNDSHYYPASTRSSVSSLARSFRKSSSSIGAGGGGATNNNNNNNNENSSSRVRVLTWGKKKDVRLPLDRFVCVRKGKTTDRARRNSSPSCRILSLITTDPNHQSLDIEAPTRLDRDKFARAFARFLDVPLVGEDKTSQSVSPRPEHYNSYSSKNSRMPHSSTTAMSEPDLASTPMQAITDAKRQYISRNHHQAPLPVVMAGTGTAVRSNIINNNSNNDSNNNMTSNDPVMEDPLPSKEQPLRINPATSPSPNDNGGGAVIDASCSHSNTKTAPLHDTTQKVQIASLPSSLRYSERSSTQAATASRQSHPEDDDEEHGGNGGAGAAGAGDDASQVSSLTGAGFDQEIVEELHQALTDLRAELEESRAEAARAVKVAEQAIQSAENSSSNDWNSTVTHKAAEAAALAQKKSAEAMAKQRLAEERLEGERRTAAFWRRQAEAAEEEAGALQTRAAAAEVQRAAMAEELECERRKTASMVEALKSRYSSSEKHQKEALESALERNRSLEYELDGTRRDLVVKNDEANTLGETLTLTHGSDAHRSGHRMKLNIMGRKKRTNDEDDSSSCVKLLPGHARSSSNVDVEIRESGCGDGSMTEHVLKLHAEAADVRKHFELLRKATADELRRLPDDAKIWSGQVSDTIIDAQSEIALLREKLALESAARRKLLHEVQDLRGVVRVYCRTRESPPGVKGMLTITSQETLLLHPYEGESPMSFKFDRVFAPNVEQREVYNEIEELCLSVMDGYNICLMAHGQRDTGKTYSMFGDVMYSNEKSSQGADVEIRDHGIHLRTAQQLFSIAAHRKERYQDVFTLELLEVYNERLHDLLAGTEIGETRGQVVMEDSTCRSTSRRSKRGTSEDGSAAGPPQPSNSHSVSSKQGSTMTKLEIRTNHNGDTVVQGLLSVEVNSFEDVYKLWQQCLSQRASRLAEQGIDLAEYEASSHVIATLSVVSENVATGMGSVGKIKFVDLAGADLVQRRNNGETPKKCLSPDSNPERGNNNDWKYSNRSLATLNDVVNCRSQYMRSVPYRNSTLTHLLRDNLEADTKVLLLLCVSAHPKDLQETACALRFASGMRRVTIGKATKHLLSR